MTNQDYFNMLTDVERESYQENWRKAQQRSSDQSFLGFLDKESTLDDFINEPSTSFSWADAAQHSNYWSEIHQRLLSQEQPIKKQVLSQDHWHTTDETPDFGRTIETYFKGDDCALIQVINDAQEWKDFISSNTFNHWRYFDAPTPEEKKQTEWKLKGGMVLTKIERGFSMVHPDGSNILISNASIKSIRLLTDKELGL